MSAKQNNSLATTAVVNTKERFSNNNSKRFSIYVKAGEKLNLGVNKNGQAAKLSLSSSANKFKKNKFAY